MLAEQLPVTVVEIDIEPLGASVMRDNFLLGNANRWGNVDWVIGNPPYLDAEAFIHRAWDMAEHGVAFLLRINFLAGARRSASLYKKIGVPDVHVIPRRPSFTPDGKTDSADYGWFVWRKRVITDTDPAPPATLSIMSLDE